jgi:hypothetical protein
MSAKGMAPLATPSPTLPTRGRVLDAAWPGHKSTSPLVGEDGRGEAATSSLPESSHG